MSALPSLPASALRAVTGGAGAPNRDVSQYVAGGLGYEHTYKSRSDSAYRSDAIEQACTQKNTNFLGGVDQPAVGKCMLDNLSPSTPQK